MEKNRKETLYVPFRFGYILQASRRKSTLLILVVVIVLPCSFFLMSTNVHNRKLRFNVAFYFCKLFL